MLQADGPRPGQRITTVCPVDYTSTGVDFNGTKQMHQQLLICILQLKQREI